MADRIEIEIRTKGDPSGAEEVGRAIIGVEDAAKNAESAAESIADGWSGAAAEMDLAAETADDLAESVSKVEKDSQSAAEAVADVATATAALAESADQVAELVEATKEAGEAAAEMGEQWADVEGDLADIFDGARRRVREMADDVMGAGRASEAASSSFGQRFFPTFSRGFEAISRGRAVLSQFGQQVGGMPGLIMQGLANPWAVAGTVAAAGIAKITKAVVDVEGRTRQFLDWAGQSWQEMGLAVERAREATDRTAAATARLAQQSEAVGASIRTEIDAMKEREAGISQRLNDDEALAASAVRLAKARIDAAAAEGRIAREEADRQKRLLDLQAAEESYSRTADAAAEKAAARAAALREVAAAVEQLAEIERRAREEAEAFAAAAPAEQAGEVDPELQRRVAEARRALQIAAREAQDPGLIERITEVSEAINENVSFWEGLFGAYALVKGATAAVDTWTQTTEEVAAAQEALAEAARETAEAEKARDAAILAAEQSKQQMADEAKARADAARAEAERLRREAAEADTEAARFQPGGVEDQIRQNDRDAAAATVPPAPAGALDLSAILGAANSPARDQFLRAVADGIEQREIAFLQSLAQTIAFDNRGNGAIQAEIEKIKKQLEDLRAR